MHTMYNHNTKRGFSLIELMVSLSVFSMVMVTSIGALLTIIDANAKAQALYSAMTNLSFAVDSMSRNIRTGYNYYSAVNATGSDLPTTRNNCSNGNCHAIVFTREKDNKRVGYRYNDSDMSIEQRMVGTNPPSDTGWLPITASTTKIENFEVRLVGSDPGPGDFVQPVINLLIKGYVNNGLDTNTTFTLQTRVTERILNY